jgi:hypothetical protein
VYDRLVADLRDADVESRSAKRTKTGNLPNNPIW